MNRSSFHGKLGPSDESTAEISLSSINTDTDHWFDRMNGSLDMDSHTRTGASLSRHSASHHRRDQRRLQAIAAGNEDEADREEDDENFLQDSFAVDDGNSLIAQGVMGASATFLMGDNYVSDVEEETEEEDTSSATELDVASPSGNNSESRTLTASKPNAS